MVATLKILLTSEKSRDFIIKKLVSGLRLKILSDMRVVGKIETELAFFQVPTIFPTSLSIYMSEHSPTPFVVKSLSIVIPIKEVSQPIQYNLIVKWTRQMLEALDYMHSYKPKPIVHRDIKSRNVFLKMNQIKLGDMGVSRVLAETFANTFLGTPFYMSPEMIRDSKYDAKSDIWALGCIVFEMVTFRRTYQCDSLMRILWKIVEDPVPRIPDSK